MKNPFLSPADFWQERDFGKKISAAFDFIGAHFKPLLKCLAYFVLPFTLLAGVGFGLFSNVLYNSLGASTHPGYQPNSTFPMSGFGGSPFTLTSLVGIGITLVGGLLAFIILSATVYGYVRARLAQPPTTPITPALVWAEIRAQLGRLLLAGLLLLVLGGLTTGVFVGLFGGFFGLIRAGATETGYAILGIFVVWLLAIYLGVVLSLYLPVLFLEELSVFATLGRCFQLVQGQWWATFGLLFTAGFLQSMLTYVFAIPQYVVMFGKGAQIPTLDSDMLGVVASSIYAVGAIFTYALPLLVIAFQYFNLVERREGRGLSLLVAQLGTPAAARPAVQSDYYRPDDEGEY